MKVIFSYGYICPKCGSGRIPWRDSNWACRRCDLI